MDSLALANAQLNLQMAYNNFFRRPKTGFPKFKSKHKPHNSNTTNFVNGNIKLQDGYLTLPKLKAVRIKQHRAIPLDYKIKSATVSKTPTGQYFVSILFEYEQEILQVEPQSFIGLDFSMKEWYVASDASSVCYPRFYRRVFDTLTKEQRKRSKCQKECADTRG